VEQNVKLERRLAQGERLAELGQMAATVAHEVKNPLSAIKSIAQVMREDTAVALEYGRDLDLIVGETDRLNQSVSQLLSFAKTSRAGGSKLNADGLVRLVGEICKTDANSRAIELQFLIESTFLFSSVVGAAVKDALTNLTLNAIHATPDGGIVKIHVKRDLKGLVLSVEDSGQGVNKAIREQIWEPFFTTKQRGTGLGLAIVQKRMSEAGGYAVLSDSSLLGGARFELHIPDDGANEKGIWMNGNGKA
jgi:signal transduction histidine kinase